MSGFRKMAAVQMSDVVKAVTDKPFPAAYTDKVRKIGVVNTKNRILTKIAATLMDGRPRPPLVEEPDSELAEQAAQAIELEEEDIEQRGAALLRDRRRVFALAAAVVLLVVAIYVILPKVVGLNDVLARLGDAKWYWVAVAVAFNALRFAGYAGLFRGVLGGGQ